MSVKNLSPAQLAEAIGVQRSGISHILSGRNKPSLDFVMKVLEAYPELNESWLLKGEGEMLKPANADASLFSVVEPKQAPDSAINQETINEPTVSINEPTTVNDEDGPYYGNNIPENEIESNAKEDSELKQSQASNVDNILKNKPIPGVAIPNQMLASDKKLVKLIAIYSDDSFKVYHSE